MKKMAQKARHALDFYLEDLASVAHEITPESTEEEIREALDLASVPIAKLREAHAEIEGALVAWFAARGRPKVRTGDLVWWIGKTSSVEARDRKAQIEGLLAIIEEETGIGLVEEERESWGILLDSLIAANGIKHGAFGKLGDEAKREERWGRAFRRKFSDSIRVKSAPESVVGGADPG